MNIQNGNSLIKWQSQKVKLIYLIDNHKAKDDDVNNCRSLYSFRYRLNPMPNQIQIRSMPQMANTKKDRQHPLTIMLLTRDIHMKDVTKPCWKKHKLSIDENSQLLKACSNKILAIFRSFARPKYPSVHDLVLIKSIIIINMVALTVQFIRMINKFI